MKLGMNLGFGEFVGTDVLHQVRSWGCTSIRTDAYMFGGHGSTPTRVPMDILHQYAEGCAEAGLDWMPLVSQPLRTGTPDIDAIARRADECAHLPNVWAINAGWEMNDSKAPFVPQFAGDLITEVTIALDGILPIFFNLTNNTTRDSLQYTQRALDSAYITYEVGLDLHPYQTTNLFGLPNNSGFSSHEEMWQAWQSLGLPLICGEWGATTARQTTGGWRIGGTRIGGKTVQYTDGQVAEYISLRLPQQRDEGVIRSYLFQLNDGPTDHYEHRHGFRTFDGQEKLCVTSLQTWARSQGDL